MERIRLDSARGFTVGDLLRISCEALDTKVTSTTPTRVLVRWPWREIDPSSASRWDGTIGFPRDPDHYDWCNTPWRIEPDGWDLTAGDNCFVGIPPSEVRVTSIERYDPPGDFGWLPRPEWVLGVCPVENLDDEEAGYVLYLDGDEPIDIEVVEDVDK